MGRLVLITPHLCIPIAYSRNHDEKLLEEGRQQPPLTQPNPAAWRLFKILFRCFTTTMTIAMIVWLFVERHLNWDPELQDPYKMAAFLLMSLLPVGSGFMITEGDIETHSMPLSAKEEEEHM